LIRRWKFTRHHTAHILATILTSPAFSALKWQLFLAALLLAALLIAQGASSGITSMDPSGQGLSQASEHRLLGGIDM
jgi:hypothetical protein